LEITANVSRLTSLITVVALTILKDNDVATVVSIKFTKDVIDVECTAFSIGRHFDGVGGLGKVLDQLLRHHNFSLKSFILFFKFLLTNCQL